MMKKLIAMILAACLLMGCTPGDKPEASESQPETAAVSGVTAIPETTAAPETTVPPDPMDVLMESLTLEQKVGQLFIAAPEQLLSQSGSVTDMTAELEAALAEYPLGGIILFGPNVVTPDQLLGLTQGLHEVPGIPMFVAVDEEGGLVARLARTTVFQLPRYLHASAVGSSGDPQVAMDMGRTIGGYLCEYGFNLDFAPVADVNTNPNNPVIGTRAFSSDPQIAAKMVAAFSEALRNEGVIATFKHFPGHGDTAEDSHSGLAVSYRTLEQLESCEFLPFREAGAADMVMVGHIALPSVTANMIPATLSPAIVTDILQGQLGFDGLVVTDSMQMGAITEAYSSGEAALAALRAGCHIVLMPENLPEAFDAVVAAVEDGSLSVQWLDSTVRKILEFKQLHGILVH